MNATFGKGNVKINAALASNKHCILKCNVIQKILSETEAIIGEKT